MTEEGAGGPGPAAGIEGRLQRVPTGVPGLDAVLRGGLFAGGGYIVRGGPGAGKTILANQVCFQHARAGGKALFVTLLAENHARMVQHLERLGFYDPALVPNGVYYVSAFRALEEGGLRGLMTLLRREVRARGATVLAVDGLMAVAEGGDSDREFRKFFHELQAFISTEGCVALLLVSSSRAEHHPEHTMVDGLIALEDSRVGSRSQRELEVRKSRGSGALRGRHPFRITDGGIAVYPRIEALLARPSQPDGRPDGRVSTGVPALDGMMGGGPLAGTTTLVLGASGTGKTTLGMHYLARSSEREPGLHFGFYETPDRLAAYAASMGLDLDGPVQRGDLEILWRPTAEQIMDDLGSQLIEAVRRRGVKRLFVDGLGGYLEAIDRRERVSQVFAALCNELRALGVTTFVAGETMNLVGPEVAVPVEGVSVIVDNMVLLRFVELRARLHRLVSVMKVRGSDFDLALREFRITGAGIELAGTFADAESVMSGFGVERQAAVRRGSAFAPGKGPTRPRGGGG
ncbi:circadian clock protein KaiC [Craurococcus roseus]|uniref:non-specific serine/threonine protein kinase n=1 Tax=Craurococcus roseus TaxID=77585 RepID=A0ABN1F6R3_9PROT